MFQEIVFKQNILLEERKCDLLHILQNIPNYALIVINVLVEYKIYN